MTPQGKETRPAPFAVSIDPWLPSTQQAAHSQSLHGDALRKHKEELNDVKRALVAQARGGRAFTTSTPGGIGVSAAPVKKMIPRSSSGGDLIPQPYGLPCRGGLASVPSGDVRQPPGRGIQGLPGRHMNQYPGDIYPMASRGIAGGGLPKWNFERMPSLLQAPLQRDYVKRNVAGEPPSSLVPPKEAPRHSDPNYAHIRPSSNLAGRQEIATPDSSRTDQSTSRTWGGETGRGGIQRMHSQPDMRGPPPRISGMHGMIGMSWDNARTTAGTAQRGSGGAFF